MSASIPCRTNWSTKPSPLVSPSISCVSAKLALASPLLWTLCSTPVSILTKQITANPTSNWIRILTNWRNPALNWNWRYATPSATVIKSTKKTVSNLLSTTLSLNTRPFCKKSWKSKGTWIPTMTPGSCKVAVLRDSGNFVICDRDNERSRMQIFSRIWRQWHSKQQNYMMAEFTCSIHYSTAEKEWPPSRRQRTLQHQGGRASHGLRWASNKGYTKKFKWPSNFNYDNHHPPLIKYLIRSWSRLKKMNS